MACVFLSGTCFRCASVCGRVVCCVVRVVCQSQMNAEHAADSYCWEGRGRIGSRTQRRVSLGGCGYFVVVRLGLARMHVRMHAHPWALDERKRRDETQGSLFQTAGEFHSTINSSLA